MPLLQFQTVFISLGFNAKAVPRMLAHSDLLRHGFCLKNFLSFLHNVMRSHCWNTLLLISDPGWCAECLWNISVLHGVYLSSLVSLMVRSLFSWWSEYVYFNELMSTLQQSREVVISGRRVFSESRLCCYNSHFHRAQLYRSVTHNAVFYLL